MTDDSTGSTTNDGTGSTSTTANDASTAKKRSLDTDSSTDQATLAKAETAPHPEHSDKIDSPGAIASDWKAVAKRAFFEFNKDQCTDIAAGLTYYSVLSLFPALIALVSLLGVFGQGQSTVNTIIDLMQGRVADDTLNTIEPVLTQMVASQAAGFALVAGILGALWSASGYVGAFGRAMNRMYEVGEGRPIWKLRPIQLGLTLVILVLTGLVLMGLVVSGPVAKTIGDAIGAGGTLLTVWNWLKWPVMLAFVIVIVALLYYVTPNVQQPKFRWVSIGAVVGILVWVLASVAFGFYVSNFGSYNKTYGTLAGVVIGLLWLWITNLALLFGAEIDSEVERVRQLRSGIKAEGSVQLPPRDTKGLVKRVEKQEDLRQEGRLMRLDAEKDGGSADASTGPRSDAAHNTDSRA